VNTFIICLLSKDLGEGYPKKEKECGVFGHVRVMTKKVPSNYKNGGKEPASQF
jgi:hypothetical protein